MYSGSPATLSVLCNNGLDVDYTDKYGETLLVKAAMGGEYDKVLVLLEAGANYNPPVARGKGFSFFHHLRNDISQSGMDRRGIDKVVRWLEAKGTDPTKMQWNDMLKLWVSC